MQLWYFNIPVAAVKMSQVLQVLFAIAVSLLRQDVHPQNPVLQCHHLRVPFSFSKRIHALACIWKETVFSAIIYKER